MAGVVSAVDGVTGRVLWSYRKDLPKDLSAEINPICMARLVDHAKTIAALGQPLAVHPRMSAELTETYPDP